MVSELHPWSSPPSSCHKTLFPVIFDPPSFLLTHSIITHLWRLAKMEKKPVPFLPPRAPSNKLQWKPTLNPFTFGSIHSSIVSQNPNHKNSLYSSIDVDLSLLEAMEEISEGKFEEAIENLTEAKFPELTHDSTTISMDEENEKAIEEHLSKIPGDANVIRSLVEVKVSAREIDEAIQLLDRLIELHPEEFEWPLLKVDLYGHNGEHELARNGFEDLLKKDPLFTEAYHGLLMATSELDGPTKDLLKRIEEAIKSCEEQKMGSEVREFKLLMAQIKVMEEDYSGALKVYQELVKEEPRDFRPYLCQGVVYTLLRKKDEADKQFEKYRKLVPENHPYKEYFEDNTKVFSQELEKGRNGTKS